MAPPTVGGGALTAHTGSTRTHRCGAKRGMLANPRPAFHVPEDAALQDPQTLMAHLLDASVYARGSVDGSGFARLLEAAAHVIQQQMAECHVQRGLAISSQTLATELAMKCEQLQVRPCGPQCAWLSAKHCTDRAIIPPFLSQAGGGGYMHDQYHSPRSIAPAPAPPQSMFGGSRAAAPAAMPAPPVHQSPTMPPHVRPQQFETAGAAEVTPADGNFSCLPGETGPRASSAERGSTWMGERQSDQWRNGHPSAAAAQTYGSGGSPPPRDATREGQAAANGAGTADPEAERAVDGMVFNLKQRFKQSGVTLPLEKHAGTVYRLGSRKLQLSIRNSRLMVRVGASYTDFLEYLSKAAL